MISYEVPNPILNSPFEYPNQYWYIREGEPPELRGDRRIPVVFPPRDQKQDWEMFSGVLEPADEFPTGYELKLVTAIRKQLDRWRDDKFPGATRTTLELLQYWRREGREKRLFFAQLEAAETIIFLREARSDYLQGINVPIDDTSPAQKLEGLKPFKRYACKMATGSGKTTVMAMLAAWSILNKINDKSDSRFSDLVLVVCPNVTIRNRLGELDPNAGEASLYRKRDIVPERLMPNLRQGKIFITNWHIFEKHEMNTGGTSAKVAKTGVPVRTKETITIGNKTTTARGTRYLTLNDFQKQLNSGLLTVLEEHKDKQDKLKKVSVERIKYVESDTAWMKRVLGKSFGSRQNILVFNDEAHHAYRIREEEKDEDEEEKHGEKEIADDFFKEATIWVEGLDRINKQRGVNFCIDLTATPYYLGRVGRDTNKPFPWVVSDFGLIDAIESGLTKIPQMVVRDTTGAEVPRYHNIWTWILDNLTSAERGAKKSSPKPEAILKYANHPIAILGGLWEEVFDQWEQNTEETRPPVFILVCKNTRIAKVVYEWLAEKKCPTGIPPARITGFLNTDEKQNTVRIDSKVVQETNSESSKTDESRWMRLILDTVGKTEWESDTQGRPIYPDGFLEIAHKLNKPLHPPGRDIRCIVSVGMLTEGWDCNTVTHIIGIRPFMSQLLCEQVVGRGLRRTSYDLGEDGLFSEEIAKILGVPFEVIPFKANPTTGKPPREKRNQVRAIPAKIDYEIQFPRIEGYTQAIKNKITINWKNISSINLVPGIIPPEVEMKGMSISNKGRISLSGPGALEDVNLQAFRNRHRVQELVWDLAGEFTKRYKNEQECEIPPHRLFFQLVKIINQFLEEKVNVQNPADLKDVFLSPYFGWFVEVLLENIRPDVSQGETPEIPRYESGRGPGSTKDVNFWTSRDVREVFKSHVNYVVADTKKWEQTAAYYIDKHNNTIAFVKNAGLGFAIPYLYNGQMHDYIPDFIIRLNKSERTHLILETKGYDQLEEVKKAAAERWVAAVNAEGSYGKWIYRIARKPEDVRRQLDLI